MRREYRYVNWIEFDPASTVFRFRIGTLSQIITIRLRQNDRGWWELSRSHAIKTPLQCGPYWESRSFDKKETALSRAITGVSHFYRAAIEDGYTPSEEWLRPRFGVIQGRPRGDARNSQTSSR
jgi:hypothetical protein